MTGLVFCADCGANMYNHIARPYSKKNGKRDPGYDAYNCSSYKLSKHRVEHTCTSHYISSKALRDLILFTIRTVSQYAIANKSEFVARVREASAIRQDQVAKEMKRKLSKDKKRYAELDLLYKKLYESYAIGKISESKFEMLTADYEKEQAELQIMIAEAETEVAKFEQDNTKIEQFYALAEKYTDFSELTTPMLNEFVEKVLVHAPDRSSGTREQEVEIYLNFIGNIDFPIPEPTQEEIEQMKIDKYWKDRYQRTKKRELARRKKEHEALLAKEAEEEALRHAEKIASLTEEIRANPQSLPFTVRPSVST